MYKYLLCMRYLTTRYIALICVVSVMLGVMTMIVVNSVMGGFREKMRDRLHGILSDVVVMSNSTDGFPDPKGVMQEIQKVAGDRVVAMTPSIEVFAMLHYQDQGEGNYLTRTIKLVGIDPKGRAKVGEFQDHLYSAENRRDPSFAIRAHAQEWRALHPDAATTDSEEPPGAIIGYQIATYRRPGMPADYQIIAPGQEVNLTTYVAGTPPRARDFRVTVTDFFKSDMSEYDSQYVYVPYRFLQEMRGMGDAATSIQIKLKDYADAPEVVASLQRRFNPVYFNVATWEHQQGPLLHAVNVEAFLLNFILFFIVAVAGFGILAIFFMIVVEKTRDIGILKALGASNQGVMGIFLSYGLTLGLVGCGLGALFGILISVYINPIEQTLANWTGREIFPRDIYYFQEIPSMLDPFTVIWIVLGALFIAVAASVLPARRAARLHPVEALRYE